MVSTTVDQKYNLSVVSGGKAGFPAIGTSSGIAKNVSCLTNDKLNFITPFNNQLKIYSVESRQCIKTIKFLNNKILSDIFADDSVYVADILLENIQSDDSTSSKQNDNRNITVVTNKGHLIALNYVGKLTENLQHTKLTFDTESETILKVFYSDDKFKVLTTSESDKKASFFVHRLYSLDLSEDGKVRLQLEQTYNNVILSTWSLNNRHICVLCEVENKKQFTVNSIFDDSVQVSFPQTSINNTNTTVTSANSKYVTSMALDNECQQLALGFASGVIVLLNIQSLQSRILKWHIDAVLSLCFTQDSMYLLSGGWEKVVSFWQLSTNSQQFLPRLNGVIVDCQSICDDKYYLLTLQLTENISNTDYQVLLLNAVDLKSKLSINGPLTVFNDVIKNTVQPISAITTRTSTSVVAATTSTKKLKKKHSKSKRQDYTTCVEIHPITKHLYFPHMVAVQSYDFYKNEQVNYQYLSSGINNSMGKVRSELNIRDPLITDVKFTKNGKWMITYEIEFPPTDLLSSKDLVHVLKFWTKDEKDVDWALKTKVINPHGHNATVTNILAVPAILNNSEGCLTADNNGGLKYWSFDHKENNWCLTKILLPNFNNYSNSVSLAFSNDGSLVFHAFDDKLTIIEFDSFKKFESKEIMSEFTLDSEIQAIEMANDFNLVIATHTTLSTFNLLQAKIVKSFDIYPYVKGIYKNGHLERLLACDKRTGRIALVVNCKASLSSKTENSVQYKSTVFVFESDLGEKLGHFKHDEYIAWIGWNFDTDFIFMDLCSRLGVVGTTVNTEMSDEFNNEHLLEGLAQKNNFADQLNKLAFSKDANAHTSELQEDIEIDFINGENSNTLINMNSFTSMFDNIQNVQMDTFFDRVMRVIK